MIGFGCSLAALQRDCWRTRDLTSKGLPRPRYSNSFYQFFFLIHWLSSGRSFAPRRQFQFRRLIPVFLLSLGCSLQSPFKFALDDTNFSSWNPCRIFLSVVTVDVPCFKRRVALHLSFVQCWPTFSREKTPFGFGHQPFS